jgi:hypothetical protein
MGHNTRDMRIEPEIAGVSTVLLGHLNPAIFTPAWFARQGILSAEQADAAEVIIIHPQIAHFRMDWLVLRVEPERFSADTSEAPYARLLDLVVRTFREFLPHTPLGRLGINRTVHFSVGSQHNRDRIARMLAPREPWGEWGPFIDRGEGENQGGLLSLTMQQRQLDDRNRGHVQAKIEPSVRLPGRAGIFMEVNDHYEVEDPGNVAGSEEIIGIPESRFDESLRRSEWIIDQIMSLR